MEHITNEIFILEMITIVKYFTRRGICKKKCANKKNFGKNKKRVFFNSHLDQLSGQRSRKEEEQETVYPVFVVCQRKNKTD